MEVVKDDVHLLRNASATEWLFLGNIISIPPLSARKQRGATSGVRPAMAQGSDKQSIIQGQKPRSALLRFSVPYFNSFKKII